MQDSIKRFYMQAYIDGASAAHQVILKHMRLNAGMTLAEMTAMVAELPVGRDLAAILDKGQKQ